MMSMLPDTHCPVCGHHHNFCSIDGLLTAGLTYDFHCPEQGKRGALVPTYGGETVRAYPQGAIRLIARQVISRAAA